MSIFISKNGNGHKFIFRSVAWVGCFVAVMTLASVAVRADDKITFDDHIKPLLQKRCGNCHNTEKRSASLDLTNFTNMMEGGASGAVIEPGDPSSSYLYMLITHEETPIMPPGENSKLPDAEIALIAKWIELGALESKGSVARVKRPAVSSIQPGQVMTRPEVVAVPPRLPLEPVLQTEKAPTITAIGAHPWASVVAVAAPHQILLYRTDSGELSGILPFPQGQPNVLRFSRNGSVLLAAGGLQGAGGKVYLYDVASGELMMALGDEVDTILAADISSDHRLVALGGPQKMVRVFSTETGELVYEIKKHTDWVTAVEFSPDGVLLATGDRNGGLFVWEAMTGNEYLTLKGHSDMISDVTWRADSNVLASASRDTTIRTWEMENGRQLKSWAGHGGGVTSVEFTMDGNLVSCGHDRVPKAWKQDGTAIRNFEAFADVATAVAYCNETKRVVAGDWTGRVRVFNLADGTPAFEFSSNPPALAQRLAMAQKNLEAATAKHAPLAQQLAEVTQKVVALDAAVAAAEKRRAEAEQKLASVSNEISTVNNQLQAVNQQMANAQQEMQQLQTAKPEVQEAHQRANTALQTLAEDGELQQVLAALAGKLQSIDQRVGELGSLITQLGQQKTSMQTRVAEMNQIATTAQSEMQAATSEIDKLNGQKAPEVERQAQLKQAVEAAAAEVARWQSQVGRWTAEIEFKNTLDQLAQQLKAAEQAELAQQESLQTLEAQLAELQKQVDAQRAEHAAAKQQTESINAQILELKQVGQRQ